MAVAIRMPKMSDTMSEGVIAQWLKKVGDVIKSGDIIAEVETDKATMELENFEDGTILYIGVENGQAIDVDGIIAIVGTVGEDFSSLLGGKNEVVEPLSEAKPVVVQSSNTPTANINAVAVRMPKMSDSMVEGTIVSWLKNVGDIVKSGEMVAEVETDKATMELENYEDGTILYIGPKVGEAIVVDGIIYIVGEKGTDYSSLLGAGNTVENKSEVINVQPVIEGNNLTLVTSTDEDTRVKASPLAKALAKEKGINLGEIKGSGEGGRIIKNDVDGYVPMAKAVETAKTTSQGSAVQSVFGQEGFDEVAVSQMRKVIARRLGESKFTAPHFYVTMEINMDKAMAARVAMNEVSPVKLSFNDLVIKATAVALSQHPKVNSSWLGDKIRYNHHIHIGMAVAVEDGLLVPVIKFANHKSLSAISADAKDLGGKAKSKKLQPAEMTGNTFTISNLGMFGVDEFTAIINPPDACILAVGGIKETVGVKNGVFYATNVMKVTLSSDHRVVDGASAAAFLQTVKSLLEEPVRLLV